MGVPCDINRESYCCIVEAHTDDDWHVFQARWHAGRAVRSHHRVTRRNSPADRLAELRYGQGKLRTSTCRFVGDTGNCGQLVARIDAKPNDVRRRVALTVISRDCGICDRNIHCVAQSS
ncbi:hypothetical protein GCM10011410_13370 [Hoyosella rhizosphaerae]|uniref:Uncharacterized protein n=1 Tax=Hoyosella rhizosphaerae TaxID=1755582 RepID=A0A916U760_9ACTN|nr:hypothetical protein GCM10011410_13370 [Hoyosella rhizosphaerae]